MSDTPKNALPLLEAGQAQKHVTMNVGLLRLDALTRASALSAGLTDPPTSPADGDAYLVASPAGGAWLGEDNALASFFGGEWIFVAPSIGWRVWIDDGHDIRRFNRRQWAHIYKRRMR